MTILEMIEEWKRGCTDSMSDPDRPEVCHFCTRALIDAIERKCKAEQVESITSK